MSSDKLELTTAVLDVRPMLRGSEKAVVERSLGRQLGVGRAEANPVAQTATVSFDPARTSLERLREAVEACGYHCAGQSVMPSSRSTASSRGTAASRST
jgi:Cu2+-exporting ATPase